MMDVPSPSAPSWIREELDRLEAAHSRRSLRVIDSPIGPRLEVEGRELLNFSSNDYLGLADHPKVNEGAAQAARAHGSGAGASRLITGTLSIHDQLERKLARFKGTEAAILFSTGYQANLGILQAFGAEGVVFSDELNHASIVDGCRLARAKTVVYRHCDMADLAAKLDEHRDEPRKLIITDSVFSMDGDLAPLVELAELAEVHGALLFTDDAHATGVIGDGHGSARHCGVEGRVHLQMSTFGKALGGFGAFVACSRELKDFLVNRARSLIYTTAPPPATAGAVLAALEILGKDVARSARLIDNANRLRTGLRGIGFHIPDDPTPIVPLLLGSNERTLRWSDGLWDAGFWVHPIRPPTVPEGTGRLRITVTSEHTPEEIDVLVNALETLLNKEKTA